MEILADCGSIDTEMEVTAGLIHRPIEENATQKLNQHDHHKSMTGMPVGTPSLRS